MHLYAMVLLVPAALAATANTIALDPAHSLVKDTPALPLGLFRHAHASERAQGTQEESDFSPWTTDQIRFDASSSHRLAPPHASHPAHEFDQLVSHDPAEPAPEPNATFKQRFWFDATHYRSGGPVFLLDGGETSGAGRLPFLETGILNILSRATGGIGIVFEHRYYGKSFPTANLTTDSLRFLTTLQSVQDSNHFAKNVKLPGFEHVDLSPSKTPWIRIGGSYAGATTALARKLFPEVWWGAIASSAVTTAIVDYWEYYVPIQEHAPSACISTLQNHTEAIDSLLALKNTFLTSHLKSYFGLANVTDDRDFVNALTIPLASWQGRNWDPAVGSKSFSRFCDSITDESDERDIDAFEALVLPHWPSNPRKQLAAFAKYATYIKEHVAARCPDDVDQDECFGTDVYHGDGLEEAPWKSWSYQFCTEWGYFIGAPPDDSIPTIVSRLLTPDYTGQICKKAFPPGEINAVPALPNVTKINQYGSYELSHPRLAFIDGSADPWIGATPHSPHAKARRDTRSQPFKLIPGGVHHWDENGLADPSSEPRKIRKIHRDEVKFVKAWLEEWKGRGKWKIDN
ncbi:hypothetical protein JCM10212_005156 [Sporobolomyces blumeae]